MLAVTLGHLVQESFIMCTEVLEIGCLSRLCSVIELIPDDVQLRRGVIYFLESCFKNIAMSKQLIPAIRTFVFCLNKWEELDEHSIEKILVCLQPMVSRGQDMLNAIADDILSPLC